MVVGYKIYLHTNTDQPERHKYKMKSIRKKYSLLGKTFFMMTDFGNQKNTRQSVRTLINEIYQRLSFIYIDITVMGIAPPAGFENYDFHLMLIYISIIEVNSTVIRTVI
jgi:hypothetical protein